MPHRAAFEWYSGAYHSFTWYWNGITLHVTAGVMSQHTLLYMKQLYEKFNVEPNLILGVSRNIFLRHLAGPRVLEVRRLHQAHESCSSVQSSICTTHHFILTSHSVITACNTCQV